MFSRSNHTGIIPYQYHAGMICYQRIRYVSCMYGIIRMTPGTVVYSTAAAVSGVEYTFGIQYNNTVLYDTYDQKEMLK